MSFFDGMFVYGSSYPSCDGDDMVYFPSNVLFMVLISGSYLVCFYSSVWYCGNV